jgi:hypothetical protein
MIRTVGITSNGLEPVECECSLSDMIRIVRTYIFQMKGVRIPIECFIPQSDKDMQLLGRMYDVAKQFV